MLKTESFCTSSDLFLQTKGRELRNKQKKLDKIIQTEKSIKSGELKPTDAQIEMVNTKNNVKKDIKELKELIDLYQKSNPNWNKDLIKTQSENDGQVIVHAFEKLINDQEFIQEVEKLKEFTDKNLWEKQAANFAKNCALKAQSTSQDNQIEEVKEMPQQIKSEQMVDSSNPENNTCSGDPVSKKPVKKRSQGYGGKKYETLQAQVDDKIKEEWENIQNELKKQLIEVDQFDWCLEPGQPNSLCRVAAIDISYSKHNQKNGVAYIVVYDYPSMKIIYEDHEVETADYPYVPGFLAFKEVPVYQILFERLRTKAANKWPQLLLVDGNGILHTRNFGCASHIGVLQNLPCIGVGKTVFYIDGLTKKIVKEKSEQLSKGGEFCYLTGDSGKNWGAALRATSESTNPIIVSQGHRISLDTALACVKAMITKYRIPEPIRQADLRSRELVKQIYDNK